jgi:hypothetical protein
MNPEERRFPEWVKPVAGAAVWGITFALDGVDDLRGFAWSGALLTLAALVVVALVLRLAEAECDAPGARRLLNWAGLLQFPSAVLLAISVTMEQGTIAVALAGPWVAVTMLAASAGVARLLRPGRLAIAEWCVAVGLIFFAVGGAWVAADRLSWAPLGFSEDIVQLTAVHFHYAGLALPVLAGCVLRESPGGPIVTLAGICVLAGVPMVAIGITSSQLGAGLLGEAIASAVLALGGMLVALYQARLAFERQWSPLSRLLWAFAALSLGFGMTLALLYGIRSIAVPLPWLGIPWMRALHGTANAIGFCLCAAIGWRLAIAGRERAAA